VSFGKVSDHVTSGFFKPAEHMTNLALLVEPKSIARNVQSEYNGQIRTRDEVVADISIFANQADIDNKKPSQVLKSVKIVHALLTKDVEHFLPDGAICVRLKKVSTKGGSAYAFEDISDATLLDAAKAYYDARSEAAAAAPSFD
jgi:hypothetical protein